MHAVVIFFCGSVLKLNIGFLIYSSVGDFNVMRFKQIKLSNYNDPQMNLWLRLQFKCIQKSSGTYLKGSKVWRALPQLVRVDRVHLAHHQSLWMCGTLLPFLQCHSLKKFSMPLMRISHFTDRAISEVLN
jgi:hypothetical protein